MGRWIGGEADETGGRSRDHSSYSDHDGTCANRHTVVLAVTSLWSL
jgi:hypothetical protein